MSKRKFGAVGGTSLEGLVNRMNEEVMGLPHLQLGDFTVSVSPQDEIYYHQTFTYEEKGDA